MNCEPEDTGSHALPSTPQSPWAGKWSWHHPKRSRKKIRGKKRRQRNLIRSNAYATAGVIYYSHIPGIKLDWESFDINKVWDAVRSVPLWEKSK